MTKREKRLVALYKEGAPLDLEDQFEALLAIGDAEDKKRIQNGGKTKNGKRQTDTSDDRRSAYQL